MDTNEPIHCCKTNEELWSLFSDTYKDHHGFRPRTFWSEQQVNDHMDWMAMEQKAEREAKEEDLSIQKGTHPAFIPSPAGFSLANAFA